MKLLLKFPSRSRPSKFFATLDNIREYIGYDNYFVLATLDLDDPTSVNEAFKEKLKSYPEVKPIWGTSNNKIHACSRDMEFAGEWDIVILVSDDQVFGRHGFGREIVDDIKLYGPDIFLHYPDSVTQEKLCTLSIMDRIYYERDNFLYHADFISVCADNLAMELARFRKRYKYIHKHMFVHCHPVWGYADWDQQYQNTEQSSIYAKDFETLDRLRQQYFGKDYREFLNRKIIL